MVRGKGLHGQLPLLSLTLLITRRSCSLYNTCSGPASSSVRGSDLLSPFPSSPPSSPSPAFCSSSSTWPRVGMMTPLVVEEEEAVVGGVVLLRRWGGGRWEGGRDDGGVRDVKDSTEGRQAQGMPHSCARERVCFVVKGTYYLPRRRRVDHCHEVGGGGGTGGRRRRRSRRSRDAGGGWHVCVCGMLCL